MTTDVASLTPNDLGGIENRLIEIWKTKLDVEVIGADDDFFELGGHSLLAADLMFDILTEYEVEVPAWVLFMRPTVAEVAKVIAAGLGETRPEP